MTFRNLIRHTNPFLGNAPMMKTNIAVVLFLLFFCSATVQADVAVSFGSGANQFNMDFVTIGNPGNAADTTGNPNPAGSVAYVYNIGKYEVSRDMVTKANEEGGLKITLSPMGDVTGGPRPNMPATGVSWNAAARFVNWLNTSHGFQPAYKFAVQPSDAEYNADENILLWQSGEPGYNAANPFRNSLAQYFLPSVHEWYKAAYYDPHANRGLGGYWDYPTGSDTAPTAVSGGTAAGTAVYSQPLEQGPADITNAGGLSSYGVMGLGGNVWEWEETEYDLVNDNRSSSRGLRGGVWDFFPNLLAASNRNFVVVPSDGVNFVGFRVASISEPSVPGDFDNNGVLDIADINDLTVQSASGLNSPGYDLNGDAFVNEADVSVWMKDLFHSWIGDANLDKEFSSDDFVQAFSAGKYEAQQAAVWSEGDWNGDGVFTSNEFITAFQDGGYEQGPRTDVAAVPEPGAWTLSVIGVLLWLFARRTCAN